MTDHDTRDTLQLLPQPGDVLVTRVGATCFYTVAVVPREPHLSHARHDEAMADARALARSRGVDAWLSEDLVHFLPLDLEPS